MKMKSLMLATTALALLAGSTSAQADGLYVSVFGGLNWVADSSALTTYNNTTYAWSTDADTGFVLGGAIGGHLDRWLKGLSVELEASYRRNDVGGIWVDTDARPSTGPIDANISTFSLMANAWYEHDFGWKIRPYAGGGLGWGRAKFDGALISETTTFSTSNDGFAWQLGAGFNYEASPGVNVGLDYRYFVGPDFKEPFAEFGGEGGENGSFGTVDNDNHAVMVHINVDIN